MSHAEVVGQDVEDVRYRRGSVKGGDRALDYIGHDRVELTDEDVSNTFVIGNHLVDLYRTYASAARPIG